MTMTLTRVRCGDEYRILASRSLKRSGALLVGFSLGGLASPLESRSC